ncbi:MAG: hypothetical protein AABY42_01005 [Nitrospirota bacterium]
MRKVKKKKRTTPRIPLDAVMRLGSHALTTKKGSKGYDRKKARVETVRTISEEATEQ